MNEEKIVKKRILSLKLVKKIIFCLVFVLVFDFILFPMPALADEIVAISEIDEIIAQAEDIKQADAQKSLLVNEANSLPETDNWQTIRTGYYTLSAYNSEVGQCDSTPCITANGFNLCEHGIEDSVAANFLRFGTKIRIPDLFGERIFVVRDRMNKRYTDRIDIWMLDKPEAKKFGIKIAKIEILEP
ncbi:3D domain-containing protein [bacterium]|nr:3D domain-containing protein [bacterium]